MSMDNHPSQQQSQYDHPSQQQSQYNHPAQYQYQSISQDSRNLGVLTHLSTFIGYFVPPGNIIAPLAIWLIKRHENTFVAEQAKEALNFQISMTIYLLVAFILVFAFVGFLIVPVLIILDIVLTIMAAVEASKGGTYRYPFTIRFVS